MGEKNLFSPLTPKWVIWYHTCIKGEIRMKKLMIAFSILSAGALIACADNSVKPNYDAQSWFGAKVTNGVIDPDRGQFTKSGESTYTVSDGKIEIDSELNAPVSFKLNDNTVSLTSNLARVTFELDPAVVPYSSLPTATDLTNVKVAFALCEKEENSETVTNFYAWANGDWTSLDFTTIPTETYTLTMTFDQSTPSEKKVQFSIGSVTSKEFPYTIGLGTPQIDFVGSGKITQLAADQLKLLSAEIEITGGSVTITGDDMGAMNALKSGSETIEDVLNATIQSKFGSEIDANLTIAEAYAIGMITNDGGTMKAKGNDAFNVKADATATTTSGIKVRFVTPLTPNDKNATITYALKGSKTGADNDWTEFSDVTANDPSEIVIPTTKVTEGYRYFKVVTKVDLKPKN